MNFNATPQTVTVNVPTDGTYQLVVTEAAPTLPTGVTPPTDANGKALLPQDAESTDLGGAPFDGILGAVGLLIGAMAADPVIAIFGFISSAAMAKFLLRGEVIE